MKRLLAYLFLVLVLAFSFQSLSKAYDIKDFEIEGMSIGDSLLDYFNEKDILNNKLNYHYTSNKYYSSSVQDKSYLKKYDFIELYLKKNDIKYNIYSIDALIFYKNKEKCLDEMDKITGEISGIFSTPIFSNKKKLVNNGDPSGKSIYYRTDWLINNRDYVAIECSFWSKDIKNKYNYSDNLRISVTKKEIDDWLKYEAFN